MKNILEFKEFANKIGSMFVDVETLQHLYGFKPDEAEKEANDFELIRERTTLGDPKARRYLIDTYSRAIDYFKYAEEGVLDRFVDFDDIMANEDYIIFEMLLCLKDITDYLQEYEIGLEGDEVDKVSIEDLDLNSPLTNDIEDFNENFTSLKLRVIARDYMDEIKLYFQDKMNRIKFIALFVHSTRNGQSVIDSLQHSHLSEIGFTRRDYIYVVFRNIKIWLSFLYFEDPNTMTGIMRNVTNKSPRKFEETNPHVVTSKLNGSRITVAGYNIAPGPNMYYNERIFNLKFITLEDMRDRFNTIDNNLFKLLLVNQLGKGSFMVTGRDMGVGKSTMLTAMMSKTPYKYGLGILDAQDEVKMYDKFPHMNTVTLTGSEYRSISECFQIMLKQVRDTLCVSEIVSQYEVAELVNCALRLDSGISATMHNLSPDEVVPNCRNLLLQTEMYSNPIAAEHDVARSLDLIVNLEKLPGGRIVMDSVSEVVPVDFDTYEWDDLKIGEGFTIEQKQAKVLDLQQKYYARDLYRKPYRIIPLIQYNYGDDVWQVVNKPSEQYIRKLARHVKKENMDELKAIFSGVDIA